MTISRFAQMYGAELTDRFPPETKPVRSGLYTTSWFDAGWEYDLLVYWDAARQLWLEQEGGWALIDQNVTWRGILGGAE